MKVKAYAAEKAGSELTSFEYELPKLDKEDLRFFYCPTKKPISPSRKEILKNFPSRSAKLRYGIRNDKSFFSSKNLTEKFKNYLDIERIGSHL